MRTYELLVLVRPDCDDEQIASIIARYTDVIANHEGSVTTAEKWAKRRLAYEIDRVREGIYLIFVFKGTAQLADELDRLLKIDQEVMRHMICRIDHQEQLERKFRQKRTRGQERRREPDARGQAQAAEAAVVSGDTGKEDSKEN
ncbi:MAG: 30S ribosomal protein S6 [Bacillota bacterium]|jgi:small subunit ribosomal protein S6|nr:30S ribosomal protein S6 [Candidatus Fermentithermobacillaceae bacterium]